MGSSSRSVVMWVIRARFLTNPQAWKVNQSNHLIYKINKPERSIKSPGISQGNKINISTVWKVHQSNFLIYHISNSVRSTNQIIWYITMEYIYPQLVSYLPFWCIGGTQHPPLWWLEGPGTTHFPRLFKLKVNKFILNLSKTKQTNIKKFKNHYCWYLDKWRIVHEGSDRFEGTYLTGNSGHHSERRDKWETR